MAAHLFWRASSFRYVFLYVYSAKCRDAASLCHQFFFRRRNYTITVIFSDISSFSLSRWMMRFVFCHVARFFSTVCSIYWKAPVNGEFRRSENLIIIIFFKHHISFYFKFWCQLKWKCELICVKNMKENHSHFFWWAHCAKTHNSVK